MIRSRLRLGKKAFEFSLVNILMGLFFIIAMALIAMPVYKFFTAKKDVDICKASVSVKAASIKIGSAGTGLVDPTELNLDCHTTTLIVKKDGTYDINNQAVNKFSESRYDSKSTYEEKLETVMADSMAQCWDMFLRGERDPFTRLDGDVHCIMCYDIFFHTTARDELQEDGKTQTLSDFNNFLLQNYYNTKETYSQFIYNINPDDAAAKDFAENPPTYDVNTPYAVIYYSARGSSIADAAAKAAKILGGCVASVISPVKSFLGPFGKIVYVVDFINPQCWGGKVLAFAIKSPTDALIHQVGVVTSPLNKVADRCSRLY